MPIAPSHRLYRDLPRRQRVFFALGVAVLLLSSCEGAGTIAGGGIGSDYRVARQALETGNYTLALRGYESLLQRAGPAAGRLELEYAHGLLRANRFDDAIRVATGLVGHDQRAIRASALAVRGTARHEAARALLDRRARDATALELLRGAEADLAGFLQLAPELDAAGSMRARTTLIAADLAGAG